MAAFGCCSGWFLVGLLLGWVLNWLLGKYWSGGSQALAATAPARGGSLDSGHAAHPSKGSTASDASAAHPDPADPEPGPSLSPVPGSIIHQLLMPVHISAIHRMIVTPGSPTTPFMAPAEATAPGYPSLQAGVDTQH